MCLKTLIRKTEFKRQLGRRSLRRQQLFKQMLNIRHEGLGWIRLAYTWEEWRTVLIARMDIGFLTKLEDLD
jgi:hypothetical protein